jgi:hypothetical protein
LPRLRWSRPTTASTASPETLRTLTPTTATATVLPIVHQA